jgi:hypothetical protein
VSNAVTDLATLNQQIAAAEALTSGTDTIVLGADITYGATITPVTLHAGVSLVIDGSGDTLTASSAVGGLQALGGVVTIENLTIVPTAAVAAPALAAGCSSARAVR